MNDHLEILQQQLEGELFFNDTAYHQGQLRAYATDASVYEERPLAVAFPKNEKDIVTLVQFAGQQHITLIPRAAGTSLAGQVVGSGIVVDISHYFNKIIQVNTAEQWVYVQPGVIRDDLNAYLKPFGLMFGPETSTASRAMIGGMVGNNSCGLHSIVWGAVRDHIIEADVVLSDGSTAVIKAQAVKVSDVHDNPLLEKIQQQVFELLYDNNNQSAINNNFPKKSVVRRNTGYALDSLLQMQPFNTTGETFNLCKLLAGSEGTLAFVTAVKLHLLPLPPQHAALVCVHCTSIKQSLLANAVALQFKPMASELVDKSIMGFTIGHPQYHQNRFFIEGDPEAILMVEFMEETIEEAAAKSNALIQALQEHKHGYAFPVLYNNDAKMAWDVRKAGLGLLRNAIGDVQPVNLIEDCAVAPEDLPYYIEDLQALLKKFNVSASYYAHAGAGELHVEPLVNLKSAEGVFLFRAILKDTAALIKKYNGSLSGEHGDGRLRGEFIAAVMGNEVMDLFKKVKTIFDPENIFNAGKIVATPAMDSYLRMRQDKKTAGITTTFDFSKQGTMIRLAEKCSGSGDCRKSEVTGGLMCPSYMATRNEFNTTRARANVLRQFLTDPEDAQPFDHEEIKAVMDLCLSCKGCKTECPSGVDITKMKAEFLQQYYNIHGVPLRTRLISNFSGQMQLASIAPSIYNAVLSNVFLRKNINKLIGFHPDRSMPLLEKETLRNWFTKRNKNVTAAFKKQVYFFCDEFTNYLDAAIGKKAILLLEQLGYEVIIPLHKESGRTYLSKGLVKKAKALAEENVQLLSALVSAQTPIIGIEPSAILTLRDEYPELVNAALQNKAQQLAAATFMIDEFLYTEMQAGNITKAQFTTEEKVISLHTHCYQKVLSSSKYSLFILSFPQNFSVTEIASGCCGMAGSFGYEKEHYAVSQQVGELVLFPTIRNQKDNVVVAAAGTSCRHQIKDGVNVKALHPVEILAAAVLNNGV
ncbi:FAD-binding and (Fe-S)-binding domain-containing protein [Ferruginibacter sp.]|nr:FAD-binding protein [Ferruginibacter sp.]